MSEVVVVTKKDPKRVEAGKKAYEKHLLKVKEEIRRGDGTSSSTETCNSNTPEATSNSSSSKSYDVHMYGVGALAILAIGLLVYFHQKSPGSRPNCKLKKPKKDEIIDPFRPL